MFGYELYRLFEIAVFSGCVLLCLALLRRHKLLVRGTISIGLLGSLHAFRALVTGQTEALGTGLVAAAVGLGLAAVAVSQEAK